MNSNNVILRIAINTPLRRLFDYLPPENYTDTTLTPGVRIKVPFGKTGIKTGMLVEITNSTSIEPGRLKRAIEILDATPILDKNLFSFMQWAADYYLHPIGEVLLGNIPALLGKGRVAKKKQAKYWRLTDAGKSRKKDSLEYTPLQNAILHFLRSFPVGIPQEKLQEKFHNCYRTLQILEKKELVQCFFNDKQLITGKNGNDSNIQLNNDQIQAVKKILSRINQFQPFLLNGVTGSGKTEVYLKVISEIISHNAQALVLVPEIGLTPQYIERFRNSLDAKVAVLHSALTDNERMSAWLDAGEGITNVIIGTRSAIWTPFKNLGIIIVDEEHDMSYKQQEGFRYSARDLAVIRAQREKIPVVLGTATPSLESLFNTVKNRYQEIRLPMRAGNASLPEIRMLDIRGNRMDGAISKPLLEVIGQYLQNGQQVLLFLNRRGYAPVILCHDCGWVCKCPRCEIQMTYHKSIAKLYCHHCGHQEKTFSKCPECNGNKLVQLGHGTQRIMEILESNFPEARVLRIDRDTTRRKGAMQEMLEQINDKKVNILVGTQMLAKGHHFPGVTLVGIIDADQGIYGIDYRNSERLAQVITQVSGRSGRADNPGLVILQTHHPDHPLLQTLAKHDYSEVTAHLLQERKLADLPPYSYQALLRADANESALVKKFLNEVKKEMVGVAGEPEILGPFVAPIEKKAGRYRMQLLLQSNNRKKLGKYLTNYITILENSTFSRKVRWSLDVDPQDMM